jgi:putative ABC transport system substrate-binding protein
VVTADPLFANQRTQVVAAVARDAIPAIYQRREFCLVGGMLSYGPSLVEAYRQAGVYAGRILGGVSPRELPIIQPTKFDIVINLETAKALGIVVPPALLSRADALIE